MTKTGSEDVIEIILGLIRIFNFSADFHTNALPFGGMHVFLYYFMIVLLKIFLIETYFK